MLSAYFDIFSEAVGAHDGHDHPVPRRFHLRHVERADRRPRPRRARLPARWRSKRRLTTSTPASAARGLPEFRTRFGIHTGAAVVGSVGAARAAAIHRHGRHDQRRLAARRHEQGLRHHDPGEPRGLRACDDAIHFRPLGDAHAKGRAQALEVFEVIGAAKPSASLIPGQIAAAGEPPQADLSPHKPPSFILTCSDRLSLTMPRSHVSHDKTSETEWAIERCTAKRLISFGKQAARRRNVRHQ